jgi:cobyrinic acid a,c-diamide synthase
VLTLGSSGTRPGRPPQAEGAPLMNTTRIAVAKDRAFQFYYDENLHQLEEAGADLVEYSPIDDSRLPDGVDGVYLGGGYPELYAAALAANISMRESIRSFARSGGPIYAECGGFMYLTEAIIDQDGHRHEMCGIFPTRARMHKHLAALGYAELEVLDDVAWLSAGERMRGHEFRYSDIDEMPATVPRVYNAHGARGSRVDGFLAGNVLGSYFHLHFGSCPAFVKRFIAVASANHRQASKIGRLI